MFAQPVDSYREMQVASASPGELVVLLYDHILGCLRRSSAALEAGHDEARRDHLGSARDACAELLSTLDFDNGGSIARDLSGIYAFLLSEMVELSARPDGSRMDRVTAMVAELRAAFAEIAVAASP